MNHATQITIVDPRPDDYAALEPWLANGEFQVQFLPDGRSALRRVSYRPSMLWLINVRLPDWSGFDLYEMLTPTVDCPIFLVADSYDSGQELAALTLGVAKYLCKPLDFHWIDQIRRLPRQRLSAIPSDSQPQGSNRPHSPTEHDHASWRPPSADG